MKTPVHIIKFFADHIASHLGIVYSETNYYQLDTRLCELAKILDLKDVEDLHALVQKGFTSRVTGLLFDLATNNETLFFRDPPAFSAIGKTIENRAQSFRKRETPLRIWSAACSFGQEVYSLAMILDRMRPQLPASGYEIIATDVSNRALKAAEAGVFSEMNIARGLEPELRDRYFIKNNGVKGEANWIVRDELRKGLRFMIQNLLDPFEHLGTFDIVLCRNVLIYQSTESRKSIVKRIHQRLRPGGIFLMGSAESLLGISEEFEIERHERATLYTRKDVQKAG